MNEDEALETLFSAPPEEFVALRDRLARELRGQGQGAAAQALKGLRRPTLAAWALNQLARREPRALRALVATGDRLRAAAQAGGGAPLRAAHQAQREAIETLTAAAGALLERAGHPVTGEALRQIHTTLEASAAVGEEDRERLLRGRLVAPLEPPSLLELLGSLGPLRAAAPPPREEREPVERGARSAERRPRVDRRRGGLQVQLERAEQEAGEARGRAERAEEQARRLDEAALRAEERARAAREQAQQAKAAAASARSRAEEAQERVRAARAELEGASPPAPPR